MKFLATLVALAVTVLATLCAYTLHTRVGPVDQDAITATALMVGALWFGAWTTLSTIARPVLNRIGDGSVDPTADLHFVRRMGNVTLRLEPVDAVFDPRRSSTRSILVPMFPIALVLFEAVDVDWTAGASHLIYFFLVMIGLYRAVLFLTRVHGQELAAERAARHDAVAASSSTTA